MTVEQYPGYTRSNQRPLPKSQEWRADSDFLGGNNPNGSGSASSDSKTGNEAETAPFEIVDAGNLQGVPIEEQRYLVKDWIPLGEPGIVSGVGGAGKSRIMKQLGVSTALGWPDWLGLVLEADGPTLGFTAEERLKPYHRHLNWILQSRGASLADLKGRYHIIAPPSPDNQVFWSKWSPILGKVDREGRVVPTPTMSWLEKTVRRIRPALVLIENAVDVYAGNHNEPPQVAQFVREILGSLCQWGATMALNQHPSVSGQQEGSGRSATVAWENAGRWRIYCTKTGAAANDDKFAETGQRQLQLMKINEGAAGAKTYVHWDKENHLWVPTGAGNPLERAAAEGAIDEAFMRGLDIATARHQPLSISSSSHNRYAPKIIEKLLDEGSFTWRALEASMLRHLKAGRVENVPYGSPSDNKTKLVRKTGSC
jgi:RecA-family ATPase